MGRGVSKRAFVSMAIEKYSTFNQKKETIDSRNGAKGKVKIT